MKIGVCFGAADYYRSPEKLGEFWTSFKELGYDYIEGNFAVIASLSDEQFDALKAVKDKYNIAVEACNGYFPGNFVLYSYNKETGEADEEGFARIIESVKEYCEKGLYRAAALGTKVVVIGSGAARMVPDDLKAEVAVAQFAKVLTTCADVAAKYGIAVTVEPLNPTETNTVNTLSDSLDIIDEVKHANLLAMNDFYHSMMQNEPLSTLDRAGDRLVHIHICRADRYLPTMDDEADLTPLVEALKAMGYNARMSLEGNSSLDRLEALRQAYPLMDKFRRMF